MTTNFGGVDVVPLLAIKGASAGCHCSVLWLGGEGDDQLWEVPLQGAIVVCYGWGG